MFERKNQKFEHYSKLIDHDGASDDGDDLITLKREDHGLSSDSEGHKEDNLSRRKLKMSRSKRAMLKSTELGRKLVFDEEGNPHELYEMGDAEEFFKAGPEGVKDAGKKFVEGERGRLKVADVADKEEAKEKKREKKRKRKEREMVVRPLSACFSFGALPAIFLGFNSRR
jgi:ATP-dependent RNA helicase DDX10/DBP4